MAVMLNSMVSVSVGPTSCSCVERSFKALFFFVMNLQCAEGSTCFWSSSNCSCDNFSTAPEKRCLRDFGPVASCIASWIFFFQNFFGNNVVHGRLIVGNPANLLCRRELLSLFHKRSDGTCSRSRQQFTTLLCRRTTTSSYPVMSRDREVAHVHRHLCDPVLVNHKTCGRNLERLGLGHVCTLCLDPACSFGLNLLRLHGLDLGGCSWLQR